MRHRQGICEAHTYLNGPVAVSPYMFVGGRAFSPLGEGVYYALDSDMPLLCFTRLRLLSNNSVSTSRTTVFVEVVGTNDVTEFKGTGHQTGVRHYSLFAI